MRGYIKVKSEHSNGMKECKNQADVKPQLAPTFCNCNCNTLYIVQEADYNWCCCARNNDNKNNNAGDDTILNSLLLKTNAELVAIHTLDQTIFLAIYTI